MAFYFTSIVVFFFLMTNTVWSDEEEESEVAAEFSNLLPNVTDSETTTEITPNEGSAMPTASPVEEGSEDKKEEVEVMTTEKTKEEKETTDSAVEATTSTTTMPVVVPEETTSTTTTTEPPPPVAEETTTSTTTVLTTDAITTTIMEKTVLTTQATTQISTHLPIQSITHHAKITTTTSTPMVCRDVAKNCKTLRSHCMSLSTGNKDLKTRCQRTCGWCWPKEVPCKDAIRKCPIMKTKGFCKENGEYPVNLRRLICAKTCRLC